MTPKIYIVDHNCPYIMTEDILEPGTEIILKDAFGETEWITTDVRCDTFYGHIEGVRDSSYFPFISYHYYTDWDRPVFNTPTKEELRQQRSDHDG